MAEIQQRMMTKTEAREAADLINRSIDNTRLLVVEFYDRKGWQALGYTSWRECVTKEFDMGKSHLYRQLDAAKIEREISPVGEIGKLPERPLRELKVLPEGKRAEAWQAAVKESPNGKPTAKQVQNAVDDVRRKIANANGVHIEIERPDEPTTQEEVADDHEQAKAQSEDEMSDDDWVAALPLAKKLEGYMLRDFKLDALAYRHLDKVRSTYLYHATRELKRQHRGPFGQRVISFLKIDAPDKWRFCEKNHTGGCDGTGRVGRNNLECPGCRGRGYTIK